MDGTIDFTVFGKLLPAKAGQNVWVARGTAHNSAHYQNQAVDMRLPDGTTIDQVLQCAKSCGFQAGWYEN